MGDVIISGELTRFCVGNCVAIVDSGTSLLAIPMTIITKVNHAIGDTGVVSQECKTIVVKYKETIIKNASNKESTRENMFTNWFIDI